MLFLLISLFVISSLNASIVYTNTSGEYWCRGKGTLDDPFIGGSSNHLHPSIASITFTTTASGMVYILTNVEAVYRMDGPYGGAFFYHNDVEKWRGYGIKKYSSSFNAQIGDTFQFYSVPNNLELIKAHLPPHIANHIDVIVGAEPIFDIVHITESDKDIS